MTKQVGPSTDLTFEPVSPGNVGPLKDLFERNAASVSESFDPFRLDFAQARAIAFGRRRDLYYLAFHTARPVGFSMLRGFDAGYAIPSFGVFVDQGHHGRGFGRQLTVWTVERARVRGCPAVRLSVYGSNRTALALYSSLGFVECERYAIEHVGATDEKIIMLLEFTS